MSKIDVEDHSGSVEQEDRTQWVEEHNRYIEEHNLAHRPGCIAQRPAEAETDSVRSTTVGWSAAYGANWDATFGKSQGSN